MRIAVDAMGGDYAPDEIVAGAVQAAWTLGVEILLVGDEAKIQAILRRQERPPGMTILHTDEWIAMTDSPSAAIKQKKRASVILAAQAVKAGEADAFVSAGNTGALMEVALLQLGRIKGIRRPAIATFWPTRGKASILLDAGANADCKPEYLLQFGLMASVYAEQVLAIPRPRVGLLNIGTEPGKGNSTVVAAYDLLRQSGLNFVGNVEIKDFLNGQVEIAVADGFVGNMVLKTAEGISEFIMAMLKDEVKRSWIAVAGALLLKPAIKALRRRLDHSEHGGAPLLGLQGVAIKSHGRAKAKTIANAIHVAKTTVEQQVVAKISAAAAAFAKTAAPDGAAAPA